MIVPLVTGLRMSCNCEFSDFYFLWGTGFEELGIAATFLDDNFDGEHDDKRWNGTWIQILTHPRLLRWQCWVKLSRDL